MLEDAKLKVRLYMGHVLRCQLQRQEFEDAQAQILVAPAEHVAIIPMDYKMKYEAKKFRETSQDFFRKRGISWHGSVIN